MKTSVSFRHPESTTPDNSDIYCCCSEFIRLRLSKVILYITLNYHRRNDYLEQNLLFSSRQRTDLLMATVSADKLRHEIQLLLKDADLNTLSSKKVRQMLEETFKCDFTDRKKEIDDILMCEITTRDVAPEPIPSASIVEDNNHNQSEIQTNKQTDSRSDEEAPMEIAQQENRPDEQTTNRKARTPSMKIERRRTCYNKELDISDQLAEIVGGHRMPRSEVVKRMWVYFKEHHLMDPVNKQWVNCDDALARIFGRRRVRAFGMLKGLSRHMSDPDKQQ